MHVFRCRLAEIGKVPGAKDSLCNFEDCETAYGSPFPSSRGCQSSLSSSRGCETVQSSPCPSARSSTFSQAHVTEAFSHRSAGNLGVSDAAQGRRRLRAEAAAVFEALVQHSSSEVRREASMAQAVSSFSASHRHVPEAGRHCNLRSKAAGACVEALASDSGAVRRAAARAMGSLGPAALLPFSPRLSPHLGDPSIEVRDAIAATLWQLGPRGILELESVAREGKPCARNTALRMLESGSLPERVALFASLLEDGDVSVQLTAANALAQLGDDRGLRVLVAALHDERSRHLRRTGATALAQLGSAGAAELRAALASHSAEVRAAAAEARAAQLVGGPSREAAPEECSSNALQASLA